VVILHPLWLGSVKFCKDKTARIIVTMDMPALLYRWYFRARSVRSLQRNVLKFVGFRRVRTTLIGHVAGMSGDPRARWLERMHELGRAGA
jgi:putative NADPH-quinone reductase